MKIIELGKVPDSPIYHGQCDKCKVIIECRSWEIFPSTQPDRNTVNCPTQGCGWTITVKEGRYQKPWVDPKHESKEWQSTPVIPDEI